MSLEAIKYKKGRLEILNQLLLPHESTYEVVSDTEDGWKAIREMKVRGAPAIAIVGALSLAAEIYSKPFASSEELAEFVKQKLQYLNTARPTAVNMTNAVIELTAFVADLTKCSPKDMKQKLLSKIEGMLSEDIAQNKAIGKFGAESILGAVGGPVRMLTHCNTGSLATAGYGTGLGVIRSIHEMKQLEHVYCTETRPYNQGSRLTAYELVYEKIPSTLIADSAVSMAMKTKKISAVVVGADRIACNGDTANKIGTYQLALAAKHHEIPFYVAAPVTSIDFSLVNGDAIVIEERSPLELTSVKGIPVAASGIGVWNPAFDVTPAGLITGIVTEHGTFSPQEMKDKLLALKG
ncbi:predicted protein [Nematostella vectensis]|uniref:Methylthioribose-1-phosphate isomerase n=1 Tax=Nematostella vectensis TaxID=45351 RepID=MTNA_NEMVE|nr:methylthioribose-1-phosphate isomerase [Nematostella vectensis]A7RF00.1 RecName: Full=Methylthioribose-1-phosphate isomerase; Short=M1Pi; Short=MTR-1-P isomerase; AltName: Full=S-methyl-5-thioribose-1-phosphate isomerase; AltName: Full=Translation initiation factor eIF-2B subunit alpha/beta/delta-like protein [Nematostella vectensis]EDO49882.1 predicted protein [Nematostella vectensis]|eukprot:XP_001641945.1 predicted protein [Nematostella vectensis]